MEEKNTVSGMNKKPEIVVFAGPNGPGKSTFTTPRWIKGIYINADDLEREQAISTVEAARAADVLRRMLIDEKITFTFETVLSTPHKLQMLQQAKDSGYFIRGYFILTCDPELNCARVYSRVQNGGHNVPHEKITSRYTRALANIPRFVEVCDICHIYDNTDTPFRIFRKHKDLYNFYSNPYWSMDQVKSLVYGPN